jgi:NAD(P)-dependent dehydrogenase (short-subunit alcohol dehydrogenase family)
MSSAEPKRSDTKIAFADRVSLSDIDAAAATLFRLSSQSTQFIDQLKKLQEKKELKKESTKEDDGWLKSVLRLREGISKFSATVLELKPQVVGRRSRLSKAERKRVLAETISKSGLVTERQNTAKKLKIAMDTKPNHENPAAQETVEAQISNVRFSNWSAPVNINVDPKEKALPIDTKECEEEVGTGKKHRTKTKSVKNEEDRADPQEKRFRCYTCKKTWGESNRHAFYARMCFECGETNLRKRHQLCDLRGRYALVTGARIKIGFEIALRLLRSGCHVTVTTRFPKDALVRYAILSDFHTFKDRLSIVAIDLRFIWEIEAFCKRFIATVPRLDILINNAAQTIRRPAGFYKTLIEEEGKSLHELLPNHATKEAGKLLEGMISAKSADTKEIGSVSGAIESASDSSLLERPSNREIALSALRAQLELMPEDKVGTLPSDALPQGKTDEYQQQLDLRKTNSWVTSIENLDVMELIETQFINAGAPILLFKGLLPLLKRAQHLSEPKKEVGSDSKASCVPATAAPSASSASAWAAALSAPTQLGYAFVIFVTAQEGSFDRPYKSPLHVHTNMAKAALNQFVRCEAEMYATKHRILISSADTGWIDDMNPKHYKPFEPPLADADGAARVLDPIFQYFRSNIINYGGRLHHYAASHW